MSIRTRLAAMERKTGNTEPLTVFFRTFYEGRDGEIADEIYSATIVEGPNNGQRVERMGDETFEQFQGRVGTIAQGPISDVSEFRIEAQTTVAKANTQGSA